MNLYEPGNEKTCLMSSANNKGADQPVHPRSLISAFVVHCLDSVMPPVSVTKISSLILASVAVQASSSLIWLETPKDTFSHDEAHIIHRQIRIIICMKQAKRIYCTHLMLVYIYVCVCGGGGGGVGAGGGQDLRGIK